MAVAEQRRKQVRDRVRVWKRQFVETNKFPYLLLIPLLLVWGIFFLYPILWAFWLSANSYTFVGSTFVGLENFVTFFTSGDLQLLLYNTFVIGGIAVPLQTVLPLVLAVLINSKLTKQNMTSFFQILFLTPHVVAFTVIAMIFLIILQSNGVLNLMLQNLAGIQVNWVNTKFPAQVSVAFVHSWKMIGLFVLIYLAGLQSVPRSLYQAARIDGANRLQQFRYITIPQMAPIIALVMLLSTNRVVKMFDVPWVLTNQGGPGQATTTLIIWLYREAFVNVNLGYAAAGGLVASLLLGIVFYFQMQLGSSR